MINGTDAWERGQVALNEMGDRFATDGDPVQRLSLGMARYSIPHRFQKLAQSAGIDVFDNIRTAENWTLTDIGKFWGKVETNGDWDYKNQHAGRFSSELLDDFGNWHFGVIAAAYGFNLESALYGAAAYQVLVQGQGNSADFTKATIIMRTTAMGLVLPDAISRGATEAGFTWGDNPGDSLNIMDGWEFYHDL